MRKKDKQVELSLVDFKSYENDENRFYLKKKDIEISCGDGFMPVHILDIETEEKKIIEMGYDG